MTATTTTRVDWSLIWAQRGFRFFSIAMFVSLFGSGLNFTAVSWYILSATHSTIAVSMQVIVVTLPGLFVPFVGGVLIDRLDRRYLGVLLDLSRGVAVLAIAYVAWRGHLGLWHLYLMTLITGTGSAMYWATVNALVQEVIPPNQFTGANAAVLIGVQSGMLMAGAFGLARSSASFTTGPASPAFWRSTAPPILCRRFACTTCGAATFRHANISAIRANIPTPPTLPRWRWSLVEIPKSPKRDCPFRFMRI